MSVDPGANTGAAAAASAAANAAAVEALIAAELNALAADAQALQSMVTTGQVVTAQVLPSNGMTDLINVLGNRVAAALPPTLSPGDVFTAQVTGFNGPQILLQILTTVDPAQLAPDGQGSPVPLPPETPAAPLQAAVVTCLELPDSYYTDLAQTYAKKRALFLSYLEKAGLSYYPPQGAYYVLVDIAPFTAGRSIDDTAFSEWLTSRVGVAPVPGSSFFREPILNYIRFHFAKKEETLISAGERLLRIHDLWAADHPKAGNARGDDA